MSKFAFGGAVEWALMVALVFGAGFQPIHGAEDGEKPLRVEFLGEGGQGVEEVLDFTREGTALSPRSANAHGAQPMPGGQPLVFHRNPVPADVAALQSRFFRQQP